MRAVIFDFDGTIADSFSTFVEVVEQLTHKNITIDAAELERLRGMRLMDVAKELQVPKWREPLLLFFGRRQMTKKMGSIQPFDGMEVVLQALVAAKYRIFIMSSNSRQNVENFLTLHGLGNYFEAIYGGVGLLGKGHALKKILKKHHLEPTEAIYVGDEPRDVEGANDVHMPCIAVAWGFNTSKLLLEHNPMVVVHNRPQLQKVLLEWGDVL